jgi:hypothetical protein
MKNHVVKFDNFLNEAARMGSSSWKSVMNDLKNQGWDVKGNVASKDTESQKDPDDYITIELTSTRTGSEYVKYTVINSSGSTIDSGEIDADGLSAGELDSEIWDYIDESSINEAKDLKSEVISRLSDFFRVPAHTLQKFNFDGKDDIKALTKALNSTNDQGTKLYYDMAIKLSKEDLGIDEGENIEDLFEAGEVSPDQILAPADKKKLKTAFENVVTGIDKLTFKRDGTIEGRRGYFYRHGTTPQGVADNLKSVLAGQGIDIDIVDAYDDFKPWPKDSNFVVVFRIKK